MFKQFIKDFFNAMIEARQKQVNTLIARHGYRGFM